MRNIHLSGNGAASNNPAVRLDLGGYAKGYALDEAAALLKAHGVRHALVNIGGNVIALGRHGQRPWRVGIQHPRKAGVIATLDLHDGEAMGTSGDYQRYFEAGGRRYCHLLDPRSGEPASGMQSVTLLLAGERAGVRSDVLSKPFFIGGAGELETWLSRLNIAAILAIDADGTVRLTDTMRQRLRWQAPDQAFELIGGSKEDFVTRK
jgi:thiamine biosynthesis lipoprotein